MATPQAGSLVTQLPLRLRNFFARYPPHIYSAAVRPPLPTPNLPAAAVSASATSPVQSSAAATVAATAGAPTTIPPNTNPKTTATEPSSSSSTPIADAIFESLPSPYTPNRDAKGYKPADRSASKALLWTPARHANPFLPRKVWTTTGRRWSGPKFGLRRQAELVKLAKKHGVEELLPPGPKSTEYKALRRAEQGLAIKGTGVGQKVKGHKWERTMETRLEVRRNAMLEMPEMVRLWKQRGHGRGWKQWPKRRQ
ncbi:mitochondrial 54S ribosomal protein mL59 [Aspergillus homomorphus CBS 101889]|uniref:Large ribosomal subunit protein mL59 domain-containing protein n=1 Tax=Aspergillus homomorphus (strain CBS 101889) TaxID=1450537 RepID=A0A395I7V0_ASPHC|nr:hypothetical protein BO97DRAFT_440611 [Aspergillus homomorphus CBS 101889]RAL16036.1 hypothetical protein BO97DRAFT_440611 [Aspergillus homomorphus CBS 101889]